MFLSENYNTSKQKYGEKIVKELSDIGIPSRYLLSACRFYQEGVSIINLKNYFRQWMTYVVKNKNIDVNGLSFEQFYQTIQKYKRQSLNANNIYDDGKVSIRKIVDFNDMKNLPFANYWCTRKRKYWDEYSSKEPPPNFYLVTNNNFTESSNCRYVMIEMYPNGEIGYWSTNNELIDENGNSGRLPKLSEYQKSLGNAFQKIKEIQGQITENKQYNKNNNMKRTIKLNESDLHRIIKESVRRILKEWPSDDPNTDYSPDIEDNKRAREYDEFNSLEGDINRLKRSYDDKLDGFRETFKGGYINDEGDEDYDYVDTYYPSTPEARAYYDYANRVGDRSSKRKEDMEADFRLMDLWRHSDAYTRRKDKEEMEHRAKFGGFGDPYFMGRMHSKGKSMVKPPSNQA